MSEPSRRSFLLGGAGLAVAAFTTGGLVACTSTKPRTVADTLSGSGPSTLSTSSNPSTQSGSSTEQATPGPVSSTPVTGSGEYSGDLASIALGAALENLVVGLYRDALRAARSDKLGTVPAAFTTFLTEAVAQHTEHAAAWNGLLAQAGKSAISGTPLTIAAARQSDLRTARTVPAVAKLALSLETTVAETYTSAVSIMQDPGAIMTAASIQPVEAMHAAVLNFLLGNDAAPDAQIGVDLAAQPGWLTV